MAVKDDFLAAGGFRGELICKVCFMESVVTYHAKLIVCMSGLYQRKIACMFPIFVRSIKEIFQSTCQLFDEALQFVRLGSLGLKAFINCPLKFLFFIHFFYESQFSVMLKM